MKSSHLLIPILAATLPIAALTSCRESGAEGGAGTSTTSRPASDAKYHYAVAMTGVV